MSREEHKVPNAVGIVEAGPEFNEIGPIEQVNRFIRSELHPFARRMFGVDKVPQGESVQLSASYGTAEGASIYTLLTIQQLGGLGVKNLEYEFQIVQRQPVKDLTGRNWNALRQFINTTLMAHTEDPLPPKRLSTYPYLMQYHAIGYTLRYGQQANMELWGGYEVGTEENYRSIPVYWTNSESISEMQDSDEEATLSLIESECHCELTSADVDAMYRVLARFGHKPANAKRAQRALADTNPIRGRRSLPDIYDFS